MNSSNTDSPLYTDPSLSEFERMSMRRLTLMMTELYSNTAANRSNIKTGKKPFMSEEYQHREYFNMFQFAFSSCC